MANPGYVTFQTFPYPNGIDTSGRRIELNGMAVPVAAKTVVPITAWSIATTGIATFTAVNTLVAGQVLLLSGAATGIFLNGMSITVISASSTSFTATVALPAGFAASTTENMNGILLANGPAAPIQITSWSLTSNVITFQAINTLATGNIVYIGGLTTGAFANLANTQKFLTVNATPTGTSFACNLTYANGSATETGTATIYPTYTTGGLPCVWFPQANTQTGQLEYPVAGGANPLPTPGSVWFDTTIATAYYYIYDPVHNTMRALTASTEVASGAQMVGDLILYEAQFNPQFQ